MIQLDVAKRLDTVTLVAARPPFLWDRSVW